MSKMIPVEGMDGYYRDTHSGAIVNKNNDDFKSYLKRREKLNEQQQEVVNLQDEVTNLKSDVNDIKNMLHTITDLLNK
jgi:predicted nuclease with TOPRIM domain|tara:strand:+ start:8973 stop:9206 length:234 start_codon:yes stop_codon:yes gene_type:complete